VADTVTVSAADVQVVTTVLSVAARAFGSSMGEIPLFGAALEACGRMSAAADASALPDDPVKSIDEMAVVHHEMMSAYDRAGFDHSEAFTIVLTYITANAHAIAMRASHG
jgi:hypothetical protein